MSQTVKPFGPVERALLTLIVERLDAEPPVSLALVGGDFAYDPETMPYYIRIDKVPGGTTGQLQGDFIVDLEVFAPDYGTAESLAFSLEALVLGYPHSVVVDGRKVVLDSVDQNSGVADLPWEDDSTYRLGATYVITLRRN